MTQMPENRPIQTFLNPPEDGPQVDIQSEVANLSDPLNGEVSTPISEAPGRIFYTNDAAETGKKTVTGVDLEEVHQETLITRHVEATRNLVKETDTIWSHLKGHIQKFFSDSENLVTNVDQLISIASFNLDENQVSRAIQNIERVGELANQITDPELKRELLDLFVTTTKDLFYSSHNIRTDTLNAKQQLAETLNIAKGQRGVGMITTLEPQIGIVRECHNDLDQKRNQASLLPFNTSVATLQTLFSLQSGRATNLINKVNNIALPQTVILFKEGLLRAKLSPFYTERRQMLIKNISALTNLTSRQELLELLEMTDLTLRRIDPADSESQLTRTQGEIMNVRRELADNPLPYTLKRIRYYISELHQRNVSAPRFPTQQQETIKAS